MLFFFSGGSELFCERMRDLVNPDCEQLISAAGSGCKLLGPAECSSRDPNPHQAETQVTPSTGSSSRKKTRCMPQKRSRVHFSLCRMTEALGSGKGPRTTRELNSDMHPENPYALITEVHWLRSLRCCWLNLSELVFS